MIAAAMIATLTAATPGAETRKAAQQLFQQGREAFERGDHDQAVRSFGAAYEVLPLPEFLFNIGLAYRMDGKCKQAAKAYARYLEVNPEAPNRAKVEQRIGQMHTCAANVPAQGEPEAEPLERPAENAMPPPLVVEVPVERPLGARRPLGWVLAGGGLVAAALGAGFYVAAGFEHGRLSQTCAPSCRVPEVARAQGQEQLGLALLAAGATVFAAGVVLWVLDVVFRAPLAVAIEGAGGASTLGFVFAP